MPACGDVSILAFSTDIRLLTYCWYKNLVTQTPKDVSRDKPRIADAHMIHEMLCTVQRRVDWHRGAHWVTDGSYNPASTHTSC